MSDAEVVINRPAEWRSIHKAGMSPEPDARLLLLCRQWHELERALERATEQLSGWELLSKINSPTASAINSSSSRSSVPREASLELAQDRLMDLQDKIVEQIATLPALTISGLTAKLVLAAAAPIYANDRGLTQSVLEDSLRIPRSTRLHPLRVVSGTNPDLETDSEA